MMAHWGESEITFRRRLALVDDITTRSNPRFGIDHTVASMLERLKSYYGAESSLIVFADSEGSEFRLQRTGPHNPGSDAHLQPVAPDLARRLLELSPEHAAVHNARSDGWWHLWRSDQLLDVTSGGVTKVGRTAFAGLAAILDAKSLVTVPVRYHGEGTGRLYVVAGKPVFAPSDMRFLLQVLDHVRPIIDNIRLVEQLATHAADEERRKVARDIHDSVIQPYLGLQMGLAALHAKAGGQFPQLSRQVERLMELAGTEIDNLRGYITRLKQNDGENGGLLPAMRRFVARFSDATGIDVQIETEGDIHATGRLAAEAFQMMAEGLSNIRRHTHALHATVRLASRSGHLILAITNECPEGSATRHFTPISITERAASLGGTVKVSVLPDGGNSVIVDIPL